MVRQKCDSAFCYYPSLSFPLASRFGLRCDYPVFMLLDVALDYLTGINSPRHCRTIFAER